MRRLWLGIIGSVVAMVTATSAFAVYPEKPIRLIVPFGSGESDVVARLVAAEMSKLLGQPILVEDRPGSAGNIAAAYVARAKPDGYTLLAGFSNVFVTNPSMYKNVSFDPEKDFEPISLVAESQFLLVVKKDLPVSNVRELIEYAKQNPGKLTFSSGGVGSPLHLAGELFMTQTGTKLLHVPYTGGVDAARAVLNGEVDMIFGAISSSLGNVKAGNVKAIALTGQVRYSALPDVPTISESGVPGFNVTAWHSIIAPANTPKEVVNKLHDAIVQAIKAPEVSSKLEALGLKLETSTGEELSMRIKSERALWAKVIKDAGIQLQ